VHVKTAKIGMFLVYFGIYRLCVKSLFYKRKIGKYQLSRVICKHLQTPANRTLKKTPIFYRSPRLIVFKVSRFGSNRLPP